MNKMLFTYFVTGLTFVSIIGINYQSVAMDQEFELGGHKTVFSVQEFDYISEIERFVRTGDLKEARVFLEENFSTRRVAWEQFLSVFLSNVIPDVLRKMEPSLIRDFSDTFTRLFPEQQDAFSLCLHICEAVVLGLKGAQASENLSRAHGILDAQFEQLIINSSSEIPGSWDELSLKEFTSIFMPLIARMNKEKKFNFDFMDDYLYMLFQSPFDENRALFLDAEEYIQAMRALLISDSSDSDTSSSESSSYSFGGDDDLVTYLTCLHLYRGSKDSELRQSLLLEKYIDFEDAYIFLKALDYRGVSKLENESIELIQKMILRGWECHRLMDNTMGFHSQLGQNQSKLSDSLAEEYPKVLSYEDTLNKLYVSADKKIKARFEIMMNYFKQNAIQKD